MSADEFVSLSSSYPSQDPVQDKNYEFFRVAGSAIEIYDGKKELIFEIQASSPILSIFGKK